MGTKNEKFVVDKKFCLGPVGNSFRVEGGCPALNGTQIYHGPAKGWEKFNTPDFQSFVSENNIGSETVIQIRSKEDQRDIFQVFIAQ